MRWESETRQLRLICAALLLAGGVACAPVAENGDENGDERIVSTPVIVRPEIVANGERGSVLGEVWFDAKGKVVDLRITRSDVPLANAAVEAAVRQWVFRVPDPAGGERPPHKRGFGVTIGPENVRPR